MRSSLFTLLVVSVTASTYGQDGELHLTIIDPTSPSHQVVVIVRGRAVTLTTQNPATSSSGSHPTTPQPSRYSVFEPLISPSTDTIVEEPRGDVKIDVPPVAEKVKTLEFVEKLTAPKVRVNPPIKEKALPSKTPSVYEDIMSALAQVLGTRSTSSKRSK